MLACVDQSGDGSLTCRECGCEQFRQVEDFRNWGRAKVRLECCHCRYQWSVDASKLQPPPPEPTAPPPPGAAAEDLGTMSW